MNRKTDFNFTPGVVGYPVLFILAIWIVFWIEVRFGVNFNYLGIFPRKLSGLLGIIFSPFIHSGIKHLFNNTIPLFVLSMALSYFYKSISWKVLGYGFLFTGFITWLIARPAYHIGASGIIYLLASFLFFKGIFSKYYRLVALSLMVVFLYGGLLWYVTPIDPEISWEGHLSGLIVGLFFAFIFKKNIAEPPKYIWEHPDYDEEEDDFMRHFDEHGNFIEKLPDEITEDEQEDKIEINYIYKEQKNKKD